MDEIINEFICSYAIVFDCSPQHEGGKIALAPGY